MQNKQKNSPYSKDFKKAYNNIDNFMTTQNTNVPNILRFNIKNNENSLLNKQSTNTNETKKFGVRSLLNMPNDIYLSQKDNNITNTIEEQQKQFINELDNFMKNENLTDEENLIEYNNNIKQSKNINNLLNQNIEKIENNIIEQNLIEYNNNIKQSKNINDLSNENIEKIENNITEQNILKDNVSSEKDIDIIDEVAIVNYSNVINNKNISVNDSVNSDALYKSQKQRDAVKIIHQDMNNMNTVISGTLDNFTNPCLDDKNIDEKKIDNKKYYNIESIPSDQYQVQMNMNQIDNIQSIQIDNTQSSNQIIDTSSIVIDTQNIFPKLDSIESNSSVGQSDSKVFLDNDTVVKNDNEWGNLNIDQIIVTFRVIGDLKEGTKLKLVNNTHLAEDKSIMSSFYRSWTGQGRGLVISFLGHLLVETKRNIAIILNNVRNNIEYDTNIDVLERAFEKMCVFLHKFDTMRNVYIDDTSSYAELGVIRDNFHTFKGTFFRDIIPKKN